MKIRNYVEPTGGIMNQTTLDHQRLKEMIRKMSSAIQNIYEQIIIANEVLYELQKQEGKLYHKLYGSNGYNEPEEVINEI